MSSYDVIIAGGGLAGLGLALQLKKSRPQLSIVVVEKQGFPRPPGIAKVGESTVEIGSKYLCDELGLRDHLNQAHLRKFGLRMFFGRCEQDLAEQDELGVSQDFGLPTYQIDRGVIENKLADELRNLGVEIIDRAEITKIELGESKQLRIRVGESERTLVARWLVDAAGRAALLKNHLQLAERNAHKANAVWFRIDKKIEIDSWSENTEWVERCETKHRRWLSTNHLVGPGYWVWIIPLASGVTSIGIVMDDDVYRSQAWDDKESAMRWLSVQQPRLAVEIDTATFLDYVALEDYSYGCKKLYSSDRWAITGEGGLFADPFYSPGSDFIAFSNCFIHNLIVADFDGEDIHLRTLVFEKILKSIYENTLTIYVDQFGGFGDRLMMSAKLLWDYSYYWGILALLYFRGAFNDYEQIRKLNPILQNSQQLNKEIQDLLRARAKQRLTLPSKRAFIDHYKVPCLKYFNSILVNPPKQTLEKELESNCLVVEQVAAFIRDFLSENRCGWPDIEEQNLVGDYRLWAQS